jgi:transposase
LKINKNGSLLKLGLDMHRDRFVMVAQYDHATPRAPRGFAPSEFVPWVEARLREGFEVRAVDESCGFGFGLYRALLQAGAHCYVIAPQKLHERNTRVKTDRRDSRALCLRLDRYLAGNKNSLAVIRVPSEEEQRARHWSRQRERLVITGRKMEAQGRAQQRHRHLSKVEIELNSRTEEERAGQKLAKLPASPCEIECRQAEEDNCDEGNS